MNKHWEICVDFDGTCTTHDFPRVGHDIGAAPVLRELVDNGHKLILFTMRSDIEEVEIPEDSGLHPVGGDYLTDAINWFKEHDIPLYGIQTNPTQEKWTKSPKAYGQLYIDDAALGAPLMHPSNHDRPFIDWVEARKMLVELGLIK